MVQFIVPWLNFRLVREMGKMPQILPEIWRCPRLASFHNQTTQRTKMGKYSFKSGIITLRFGEKYTSLLRIFEEPWRTCWRWLSSRLQLAVKYHEIISSMLCWMLHHLCTVSTWDSHRAGRQYQWRWTWTFWRRCRSESRCKAEGARCYPDQFTERATES